MAVKTESDIQIENKSYTNKDFTQIYPELIDLAKTLTNKWDPETTNESDPGLVLIKLLAFIGDKNNYNIDKNILEQFMPSVTQDESMRRLCDMMGYNVKYYRSATAQVSFSYEGGDDTLDEVLETSGEFRLKAFDTSFKTEDSVVYTLLEDIEITDEIHIDTKTAIQGELKLLSVDGSDDSAKVQVYNLDEENRIYFPDTNVAENGIFINREVYNANTNADVWRRVDNLNDQELGSKVFKFGYDSTKGYPYLEFPSDIADLIEDGLSIYYIVTDGDNGTVSSGSITAFNAFSLDVDGVTSLDESTYTLTNAASTDGCEPEDIDEAYRHFRKTVGTFNTLVSCRDYTDYIFELEDDETGNHYVSNVVACDTRTDPNRSTSILLRNNVGSSFYENVLKGDYANRDTRSDTFLNEVVLHGTKAYDYDITTKQGYKSTYNLIDDTDVNDIDTQLSDVKTMCHVLTKPKRSEIDFIEERYVLNVNISTKYRVNTSEQSSILKNVVNALYQNFNARQVEFGEEIPYDEIVEVIQNADERIKLVVVDDPTINAYVVEGSGSAHAYTISDNADDPLAENDNQIVIENILGGRIQLYIKDEGLSFDYKMDLSTLSFYDNIAGIKTNVDITIPLEDTSDPDREPYKLKANESIQVVEDSYIASVTYPAYCYYGFGGDTFSTVDGVPYKLKSGEVLYIYYTDSDDVVQIKRYREGTIIRTNDFDLPDGDNTTATRWLNSSATRIYSSKDSAGDGAIPMYALGTNETLEIVTLNETVLSDSSQKCFWYMRPFVNDEGTDILNQVDNDLIFEREGDSNIYFHILEEDEYFIYPSSDGFSLLSFGSGTKLQVEVDISEIGDTIFRDGADKYGEGKIYLEQNYTGHDTLVIDLDELTEALNSSSVSTFEASFNWNSYDFRKVNLHLIETSISTLSEGDTVEVLEQEGAESITINSEWKELTQSLNTSLGELGIGDITNAKIRSLLSFTGSSTEEQQLGDNQTITIYYYNDDQLDDDGYFDTKSETVTDFNLHSASLGADQSIQLETVLDDYKNIVLRTMHYEEDESSTTLTFNGRYEVPYRAMIYTNQETPTEVKENDLYSLIISLGRSKSASRSEYTFNLSEFQQILDGDDTLTIEVPENLTGLYINVFDQFTAETHLFQSGGGVIEIDVGYIYDAINAYATEQGLTDEEKKTLFESYNIVISIPILLYINPLITSALGDDADSIMQVILDEIAENYPQFDYLADLSNSKLITAYDPIDSFFDGNNVYNPITIPKIDFDNSQISIVASSRK